MPEQLSANEVTQRLWFHTSTHVDWPSGTWEPTAGWQSSGFALMMEQSLAPGAVERWREMQFRKLLHLGTYAAAIENMLRRQTKQNDQGDFFLYRVRLMEDAMVSANIIDDPGGEVGDVQPEDVLDSHESIIRYINAHEDRGSISLAVRRRAIAAVQCISIRPGEGEAEHLTAFGSAVWREI